MAKAERPNTDPAIPAPDALFGALFEHTAMGVAVFSIGGGSFG